MKRRVSNEGSRSVGTLSQMSNQMAGSKRPDDEVGGGVGRGWMIHPQYGNADPAGHQVQTVSARWASSTMCRWMPSAS